jgi:hypothetical protein
MIQTLISQHRLIAALAALAVVIGAVLAVHLVLERRQKEIFGREQRDIGNDAPGFPVLPRETIEQQPKRPPRE